MEGGEEGVKLAVGTAEAEEFGNWTETTVVCLLIPDLVSSENSFDVVFPSLN